MQGLRALDAGRRGARRQEPKPSYSRHTMQTTGGVSSWGLALWPEQTERSEHIKEAPLSAGGHFLLYKASGTLKPRGGHTRRRCCWCTQGGGVASSPRGQAARVMHRHRPALRGGRVDNNNETKKRRRKKKEETTTGPRGVVPGWLLCMRRKATNLGLSDEPSSQHVHLLNAWSPATDLIVQVLRQHTQTR